MTLTNTLAALLLVWRASSNAPPSVVYTVTWSTPTNAPFTNFQSAGTNAFCIISNLAPGSYAFLVSAQDTNSGVISPLSNLVLTTIRPVAIPARAATIPIP